MGGQGPPYSALPQSFFPCTAPFGSPVLDAFSGKALTFGGMLQTTQCTYTRCGFAGSGASGSSTIRAKLFTFGGAPDHASGGEISCPSQVYLAGIDPPCENAGDVTCKAISFAP